MVTCCGINAERQDLFGGRCGDFLDVHAAFCRADEGDARCGAVNQQGQIQFAFDVGTVFDVDAVHLLACGAGLVCDQCLAQHLFGFFGSFGNRLGQTNTALFTSFGFFEFTFATATGVDLCLYNPEGAIKLACGGFGIFCLQNHAAIGHRRAIAAKQGFRLIFVDVHKSPSRFAAVVPRYNGQRMLDWSKNILG